MSVCCVLSDTGLCDELITCPEESYRLWCVVVCDLETSWIRRPWPAGPMGGGECCCVKTQTALFLSGPSSYLLKIKLTLYLLHERWYFDARKYSDWQRTVQRPSKPQYLSKSYSKYQLTCPGKVHPSPPTVDNRYSYILSLTLNSW